MRKKLITLVLSIMFIFSAFTVNASRSDYIDIVPTSTPIYVNGSIKAFDAYNINGYNYFKLRDIAYYLSGTECQFEVDWDGENSCINIATGYPYSPVGGEGTFPTGSYSITIFDAEPLININNDFKTFESYNINNNNYFKLRDLGDALGFGVEWSDELQSVIIYTNENYRNIQPSSAYSEYVNEVLRLVNIERVNNGLSELILDSELCRAADIRADEVNTLFSHTRPDGSSCFTVLADLSISYNTCGENIAIGQRTPESVVTGWMNSPGHRANILNSKFNRIGIGVTHATDSRYSAGYSWVQLFTN